MRVELRTRPARQVVVHVEGDESSRASRRLPAWQVRCACGYEDSFENDAAADAAASAHRPVCPERDGGLVGRTTIPPFNGPPTVLFFGERVFLRREKPATAVEEAAQRLTGGVAEVYVEAEFVYAVVTPMEAT